MKAQPKTLTELEERLARADGGALRAKLAHELSELELRFLLRLSGMVPKSEYAPLTACVEAVRAAQKVLREAVRAMPRERSCKCGSALQHALITDLKLVPTATKKRLAAILEKYL